MTTITAHIDISRPSGRKIIRDIAKKRAVTIDYPLPTEMASRRTYTHEEVWKEVEDILTAHYGVPIKSK
jgi:hypothetical protein